MKYFWTFLMLVSSCFAIPVSCTGGMFVGAHYLSHHNTQYFNEQNAVKDSIYILASDSKNQLDYFAYKSDQSITDYLKNYPERRFIINENKGEFVADSSLQNKIEFEVLTEDNDVQTIELSYSQSNDVDTVVRYQASPKTIQPISQRSYSMALLFDAFPYALAFAILFSIFGKTILSLVNKKSACALPASKQ